MRNNFNGFLSVQQKAFIIANGLEADSNFWIMGEPDESELNKIGSLSDIKSPNNDIEFKKCPFCESEVRMFIEPVKKKYGYRLRCTNPECDLYNGINKLHSTEDEAADIWNNGLWNFDKE